MPEPHETSGKGPATWANRVISAGLGIVVTVVGALILARIQTREPHLVYSTTESLPFSSSSGEVSIYQASISNDGAREVYDVASSIRIPGAKIDQYKVMADPILNVKASLSGDTIDVQIPNLNPSESIQVSLLATSSNGFPTHPLVTLRGRGITGTGKAQTTSKLWSDTLPPIALAASTLALIASGIFRRLFRTRLDPGPSSGDDQRLVLAYLCRAHGLLDLADEYLNKTTEANYWSEADRLSQIVISAGGHRLATIEKILLALIQYTRVAYASQAIIYYNLALISHAKSDNDSVSKYLSLAKKTSPKEIERRLEVDPRLSET